MEEAMAEDAADESLPAGTRRKPSAVGAAAAAAAGAAARRRRPCTIAAAADEDDADGDPMDEDDDDDDDGGGVGLGLPSRRGGASQPSQQQSQNESFVPMYNYGRPRRRAA